MCRVTRLPGTLDTVAPEKYCATGPPGGRPEAKYLRSGDPRLPGTRRRRCSFLGRSVKPADVSSGGWAMGLVVASPAAFRSDLSEGGEQRVVCDTWASSKKLLQEALGPQECRFGLTGQPSSPLPDPPPARRKISAAWILRLTFSTLKARVRCCLTVDSDR